MFGNVLHLNPATPEILCTVCGGALNRGEALFKGFTFSRELLVAVLENSNLGVGMVKALRQLIKCAGK